MERWNGRVALVTGASVGIGAAICQMLCKNGLKVIGAARRLDKIQQIKSSGNFEYLYPYKCDVSNEEEIIKMFDWIEETFGHLDICVPNAGFRGVTKMRKEGKTGL